MIVRLYARGSAVGGNFIYKLHIMGKYGDDQILLRNGDLSRAVFKKFAADIAFVVRPYARGSARGGNFPHIGQAVIQGGDAPHLLFTAHGAQAMFLPMLRAGGRESLLPRSPAVPGGG